MSENLYVLYGLPILLFWHFYLKSQNKAESRAEEILLENVASGFDQPASLHPVVDSNVCIGCGACVSACPEKNVLGLIRAKAHLISPANCIGHGACKTACPVGGIELVFGTDKKGIDIPLTSPQFETSVEKIYIAGELGGMGLVRNAIEQGKQAINEIAKQNQFFSEQIFNVVIVGAGPSGIAAALSAKSLGLSYVVLEQDLLGGTVAHFPRKKLVMTAPAILPLAGKMNFKETTKEALLEYWKNIVLEHQLNIYCEQRVESIDVSNKGHGHFTVGTGSQEYICSTVLLCLGRRGTPRKLNVEGENRNNKVVYQLVDARQYRGHHVLVVGGGDSAIEAALSVAEEENTHVTIAYRGASFSRAKPKNRKRIELAQKNKALDVLYESEVKKINTKTVILKTVTDDVELHNDTVIVCAGGVLPTGFLKSIGIEVETKYGTL